MQQKVHSGSVALYVEKLVAALTARGLAAEPVGANLVWAVNRAMDSLAADERAAAMSPGLEQLVLCRPDDDGALLWWWVWSGATRDAPPEHERLGPAGEIEEAADRIARVLALNDANPPA